MLAISADHGGFELNEKIVKYLLEKQIEFKDFGVFSEESVDYPDIADKVVESILNKDSDFGIIVCGSGVGVSIRANRYIGIRAVLAYSKEETILSREHNNANVICLGGRLTDQSEAIKLIDIFLNTEFDGGRHIKRIEKLDKMER